MTQISLASLSTRARGVVLNAVGLSRETTHIKLTALKKLTKARIMSTPNCGNKSFTEILTWGATVGVKFVGGIPAPIYFTDENKRAFTTEPPPPELPHVTTKDLAARWRCTRLTVLQSYKKLGLKPIRIGNRLLYPIKQVEDAERRRVTLSVETPQPRPVGTAE